MRVKEIMRRSKSISGSHTDGPRATPDSSRSISEASTIRECCNPGGCRVSDDNVERGGEGEIVYGLDGDTGAMKKDNTSC
jgi:hypothetical protein